MRKWDEVARDLRVAAKRVDFYIEMGLVDVIEAQALDELDKKCTDFLKHCHPQWLACARDAVENKEARR